MILFILVAFEKAAWCDLEQFQIIINFMSPIEEIKIIYTVPEKEKHNWKRKFENILFCVIFVSSDYAISNGRRNRRELGRWNNFEK